MEVGRVAGERVSHLQHSNGLAGCLDAALATLHHLHCLGEEAE